MLIAIKYNTVNVGRNNRRINVVTIKSANNGHLNAGPYMTILGPVVALNIRPKPVVLKINGDCLNSISRIGLAALTFSVNKVVGVVGSFVIATGGGNLNLNGLTLKSNGYSATCGSNGIKIVTIFISTIGITIGNAPLVLANALERIRACSYIGVNLSIYTVRIGHIVGSIAGIPLGTEVSTVTRNGKCSLTATSFTNV